jgi:lysophospholipase L1-like esterase
MLERRLEYDSSSMIKKILFRLLAVATPFLVVLLLIEVGLRLAGYDPLGELRGDSDGARTLVVRESDNTDLVYELVPGAEGRAWGSRVAINSDGFRDRDYAVEKRVGTYRIAVIGDSITFAARLPAEERYPERLESKLRAGGKRVEVLNLGVGGYDTLQEVVFLEQVGLKYRPDLVVVGYCINDAGVHSANRKYIRRLQRYASAIYRIRLVQFLAIQRDKYSETREFFAADDDEVFRRLNGSRIVDVSEDGELVALMGRLATYLESRGSLQAHPFLRWYSSAVRVGKLRYALERLGDLAERHGFEVKLVIIPYLNEEPHGEGYRLAHDVVRHEATRVGFVVLDAYPEFEAEGMATLRLDGKSAIHPNSRGHEIIANRLFDHVARDTD